MSGGWSSRIERLPLARDRPWIGYAFALAGCGLGLWARMVADGLPAGYPFVTFLPPVMLAAFLFGARVGAFAGIVGWLMARYFFIDPVGGLGFQRGVPIAFVSYAIIIVTLVAMIALMQRANAALSAERETSARHSRLREIMFSELQHRVSNKLQLVASLISLQQRRVADADAKRALGDAAQRVGMIGRISRALHDPDRAGLGVADFLEQVGRDLIDTAGARNVVIRVAAEPTLEFPADAGVPIALIITETVSNAMEHGFGPEGGVIDIDVARDASGDIRVTIADNGRGLPPGFDATQSKSLGLTIAVMLARQLGGSFALRPGETGGAVAELRVAG